MINMLVSVRRTVWVVIMVWGRGIVAVIIRTNARNIFTAFIVVPRWRVRHMRRINGFGAIVIFVRVCRMRRVHVLRRRVRQAPPKSMGATDMCGRGISAVSLPFAVTHRRRT
jgi:hypothetical protein